MTPRVLTLIACSLLTLCAACETEQDLGDECLPLGPDAGDMGVAGSGSFVPVAPADQVDNPFVGRPLGATRVGRLAGCTEPPPRCDDTTGEGCFNPYFASAEGGEPTLQDLHGPCACELPE